MWLWGESSRFRSAGKSPGFRRPAPRADCVAWSQIIVETQNRSIFWIVYDEATGTTSNGSRLVSLDAYTYIYITMSEQRKAVIKNADMDEKLQQDAVDTASKGLSEYNIEKVLYCLCSCHYYLNRIRSLTHNHHFIYS